MQRRHTDSDSRRHITLFPNPYFSFAFIPLLESLPFHSSPTLLRYLITSFVRRLSRLAEEIAREEKAQVFAIRIDCSDSKSVRDAFEGVLSLGFVEVLVYNANYQPLSPNPTSFQHIPLDTFQKSVSVSSVGAFHCAQQVLAGMVERGKGTILFTGCSASLIGIAGYSQLCCGKFALRALAQCLAREFQPQGVHIAHVIIDGVVAPPRSRSGSVRDQSISSGEDEGTMDPDVVAQTYWHLHIQDRNAWTQEMDLRSNTPTFF
ncbi:Estradiol 17-beta-dehydrogenase 1 [Spatholobus suberectus]|nr:Estradiol 17-beta-dehydrogenase 1 [Spatholobus suberectus]